MSSSKSVDEVRADHVKAMGPELGALFHRVSNELIWLCWRWYEYVELVGKSPERLEILNASSPFFFRVVQETLWYETLLGISRLPGPTTTAGKENLSVRRLMPLISSSELRSEVADLIGDIDAVTAFAMEWRNKYIAHRDFGVAMGKPATSLPAATRAEVEAAIGALADLLNAGELGRTRCLAGTAGPAHPGAPRPLRGARRGRRGRAAGRACPGLPAPVRAGAPAGVSVEEEGRGFDPSAVEWGSGPGLGLARIRDRATALGWRMEIDAAPGKGSATRIFTPLEHPGAEDGG